jgi:hypothetical protein
MEMSLDPETSLAQAMCLASGISFDSLVNGVIDSDGYFVPPDRDGYADQRIGGHPRVYAWRRFTHAAQKAAEAFARNGQVIVFRRPHFFHGDHEPLRNFWISFCTTSDQEFELYSPWYRSGYYDGGQTNCAAIQARSEREAIDTIFAAFDRTPEFLQVNFVHDKPSEWSPFSENFKRESWMQWKELTGNRE